MGFRIGTWFEGEKMQQQQKKQLANLEYKLYIIQYYYSNVKFLEIDILCKKISLFSGDTCLSI